MGRLNKEFGFTLIELLVAIAILSILAAIAITQYRDYKNQAYHTTAKSDLKSALTAIENYFVANQSYPANHSDLLTNGFNFFQRCVLYQVSIGKWRGDSSHTHHGHLI